MAGYVCFRMKHTVTGVDEAPDMLITLASGALKEDGLDFSRSFAGIQQAVSMVNVANGWWKDRVELEEKAGHFGKVCNILSLLALVHSEVSEAAEAVRKHDSSTWDNHLTKDTLVRELAGTVVRIMDLAHAYDLPLSDAIIEELKANMTRGVKHGGKAA